MKSKIGEGGVPNSRASVMQRVRNKNNMAELLMRNEITEYKRQLLVSTMNINLEIIELQGFMTKLRECYSDDMSEFAPIFYEKYEFVRQFNNRVKRTRFRDLFTQSEMKTPKTRSVYASSPSKSLVRSQTLPAVVSKIKDAKDLERSVSNLDALTSAQDGKSPTKMSSGVSVLPQLDEEQISRPTTKHQAKRMGIITEVEQVPSPTKLPAVTVVQVDAWGINPSEARVKDAQRKSGLTPSAIELARAAQGSGMDLMRSMLDNKPRKKKRRRKKPLKTRIDDFFEDLEHLLTVATLEPDSQSPEFDSVLEPKTKLPPIK